MTIAGILNNLVEGLGRLFLGETYQAEEWQKIPEDNYLDNASEKIKTFKRDWQLSKEAKILNSHAKYQKKKDLDLQLYTIEVTGDFYRLKYTDPGNAVFLMYGIKPDEHTYRTMDGKPTTLEGALEVGRSVDGEQAIQELMNSLMETTFDHRANVGESSARLEFKKSPRKKEICYRLLRPFQYLPKEDSGYSEMLKQVFNGDNNFSIYKAVHLADQVTDYFKGGPNGSNELSVLDLNSVMDLFFHSNSMEENNNFDENIL